jgi:hypothetical protein
LLVRHAETEDNVRMRLSGWTDTDLSARGENQIELLADHFNREHGHIDALYSSPLIRARRTAEAIGALTGHTPILVDDLREMYFGELDGRPFEELREAYAHLLEADENSELEDFVWPSGESRSGFTTRASGRRGHARWPDRHVADDFARRVRRELAQMGRTQREPVRGAMGRATPGRCTGAPRRRQPPRSAYCIRD